MPSYCVLTSEMGNLLELEIRRRLEEIMPKEPPLPFLKEVPLTVSHVRRNVILAVTCSVLGVGLLLGLLMSPLMFYIGAILNPCTYAGDSTNYYSDYNEFEEELRELVYQDNKRRSYYFDASRFDEADGNIAIEEEVFLLEGADACPSHEDWDYENGVHVLSLFVGASYKAKFSLNGYPGFLCDFEVRFGTVCQNMGEVFCPAYETMDYIQSSYDSNLWSFESLIDGEEHCYYTVGLLWNNEDSADTGFENLIESKKEAILTSLKEVFLENYVNELCLSLVQYDQNPMNFGHFASTKPLNLRIGNDVDYSLSAQKGIE